MKQYIQKLRELINQHNRIVFFGGAGVSTESGIPDFRSEDGVFAAVQAYGLNPEELLSHDFFMANPDVFYEYYRGMMVAPEAQPNAAHIALAALEKQGKLQAVITQNIDGLHQKAGSERVLELHGSMLRNFCMRCRKPYTLEDILLQENVPHCSCGGRIRPDVVLYGEQLDTQVLHESIEYIMDAELLIVGGTSLLVYPANGLIQYFRGKDLVLINKTRTSADSRASLVIRAPIGETLAACMDEGMHMGALPPYLRSGA